VTIKHVGAIQDYTYTLSRERFFVPQINNFFSIKLQVTDNVKISVHEIFANNAQSNATNFMTKPCKT